MIIYLEGADGSGKSTLVELLKDSLHKYAKVDAEANKRIPTHPKKPGRLTETQMYNQLKQMAKDNVIHIIDRGPISDIVYRVFDDYPALTTIDKLENFLADNNNRILTIYCSSPIAQVKMMERGDDNPIAIEHHSEISKVFNIVMDSIYNTLPYNYIVYDFNRQGSINEVLALANYFCYMAAR